MEQAMELLPTANTEITQFFRQWLETFAGYVREVDYASARPLFHPDVLAFGTYSDVISGIDQWVATQWDNVWPKTTDFRFVLEQTSVLASPDGMMATVIAPWTSTGYHPDGHPFPRPGRATLVFSGNADGWLCAEPPDLEGVRLALDGIASDGKRAAELVVRLRALMNEAVDSGWSY